MSLDRDFFSKRSFLQALVIGISVFTLALPLCAQQRNPFDATVQPGSVGDATLDRPYDPVVQAIVDSNPNTPLELVKALSLLMDIDRDDLAIAYLHRLDAIQLNDQQMFDVYRQAGPDAIIRIGLRSKLQPVGKEYMDKIVAGAQRFANNEARIDQLTKQLTDSSVSRRSSALSDLRMLGDKGAAALINVLADSSRESEWAHMRGALKHFRREAEGPLMAALYANHPRLPIEAAHGLGFVNTPAAAEALYRPAIAEGADPQLQQMSRLSLERMIGRIPDATEVAFRLHRSANDFLMDRQLVGEPGELMHWWRWDEESGKVVGVQLASQSVARIRAYRRAADLAAMNPESKAYSRLYWLTRVESAKLTADIRRPLPAEIAEELARQSGSEVMMDVLEMALERDRVAAATAACELLSLNGHMGCLVGDGQTASPLVRAVQSGEARLAYAAAQAIYSIDAKYSFAGSSQYIDALIQMSKATGRRKAAVAHSDAGQARSLNVLLANVGYSADVAQTGRDLFELATNDPDLELIVLTDTLSHPDFAELTQALRAHQQTYRVPILLLVNSDNLARADMVARNNELVVAKPLVHDDSLFARQVDSVMSRVNYIPTTASERLEYAASAMEQLVHFANNSDAYPFYDLASHQDSIIFTLRTPDLAAKSCQVLGQIGTSSAQRNLIHTASNTQYSEDLRRAAADSFAVAVRKRGIMLTRDEILRQYSRYNSSDRQSPASQEILASILDAIEKKEN